MNEWIRRCGIYTQWKVCHLQQHEWSRGYTLCAINQTKTNTTQSHLYVKPKNKNQAHSYREQTGGC